MDMDPLVPEMSPAPGQRLQRFVGDQVRFFIRDAQGRRPANGWRARLRTNLGRGEVLRREIIKAHTHGLPPAGEAWRDLPMREISDGWSLELPLAEVGYFKAKAYLLDPRDWQFWPPGNDVGMEVHPNHCRTANTIYCAFTRMFGATREAVSTGEPKREAALASLDKEGYTVIPASGKLRDLAQALPHIIDTLGCRVLHLLPVHPTPTTFGRFGRFGSPYAALDLTAIDPALVTFDRKTTGVDQFRELTSAVHLRGARVFLDIVINHTGWGSLLQEHHPEWFLRDEDGRFMSPGAWGNTWEDLVELKHQNVALWDKLALMFLTWCRRGVDGFRCDAGYKVPVAAWQYIIARVQQEYPETIFLLEGLGGAWEATEALLTDGGMQWAYSELFQNYSGQEVASYLDHSFAQSSRVGLLVHYSETHDNPRLAARGRTWSLLRNRLCALASVSGGFGFTCGVEWLATEKIRVHGSTGMAWDSPDNIVPELARLNALLNEHPCFFDGAQVRRLSPADSPILALHRVSGEGKDEVLVFVNTDPEKKQKLEFRFRPGEGLPSAEVESDKRGLPAWVDLLADKEAKPTHARSWTVQAHSSGRLEWQLSLGPGAAHCLAPARTPRGLQGEDYRRARARAGWAIQALSQAAPAEHFGAMDWTALSALVERSPHDFLAAMSALGERQVTAEAPPFSIHELSALMERAGSLEFFPRVIRWRTLDARRVCPVPPGHWLLVEDPAPFRASLLAGTGGLPRNVESILAGGSHVACFAPGLAGEARILLERYSGKDLVRAEGALRFLSSRPQLRLEFDDLLHASINSPSARNSSPRADDLVLLTNDRGGMARLCLDLGRVKSKYDCLLGANLHPDLPVDRHVFAKRVRAWVNADGFITPLDFRCLDAFRPGPPAQWDFVANAGDGRTVEVQMRATMLPGRNTTVLQFCRPTAAKAQGKQLPVEARVRLTVRVDIEDRNFHWETKHNGGAEHHFGWNTRLLEDAGAPGCCGFVFTPAPDRQLRVYADSGEYHPQPEWSNNIAHPVEQSRGQEGAGDAYSPGWFDFPLPKGARLTLVATADKENPSQQELGVSQSTNQSPGTQQQEPDFAECLQRAVRAFVVRRGAGKTVIAGYPWFLDWGRDTFICARGLLAAGMFEEVRQILITFAKFEDRGTLPNTIFGDDASNRDTSDAPLWFGVVCEELAAALGHELYRTPTGRGHQTLKDTLWSIANHYREGTPNGIRMDPDSALIWSPSHFTWMDTNYPASTPREGYPVEIQALWVRLLRQLERMGGPDAGQFKPGALAGRALASIENLFWLPHQGWYSDLLRSGGGQPAAAALAEDALRSNCLFLFSLGLVGGERAKQCVQAALRYLVVPGALRTLAPLPVSVPLPIRAGEGVLLNDPSAPYWGHYEGDEDTRRKPAYHNGTAWTWTFPVFCEALAQAWKDEPHASAAARAYLGSLGRILGEGCLGHLPEILDGDAPHQQRGCDAQAWSATEALRVWKLFER
jgi:starch synthase (maltosyl-transferring)